MRQIISNFKNKNRSVFDLGIILLACVFLTLPIFIFGVPGGTDMPHHFQFAQTFYTSIGNGEFFPGLADQTNYGYGDVGVRFYPPVTYYILSFFRLIAGNWTDAFGLAVVFWFFIGSLGVYKWCREWFPENASLTGALAYIILPFHLYQIYQAAFIAEFAAASILPFCFLYVTRICRRQRRDLADIGGLILSYSLLILTHLPSLIIVSPLLVIYSLFTLQKSDLVKPILKLTAAVLVSLLLTCFYWVRMFLELDFVKHSGEAYSTQLYSYQTHFLFAKFHTVFQNDFRLPFMDLMLLITLGVLISNAVIYLIKAREKKDFPIKNVAVCLVFSIFMVTPLSSFVWAYMPLFQKIQFPWRWLILVSLFTAVFVAAGFSVIGDFLRSKQRYLAVLAGGLIFVCILFDGVKIINHHFYYPRDYFEKLTVRLKTSSSCECWWTFWAKNSKAGQDAISTQPSPFFLTAKVSADAREFEIKHWSATERIFAVNEGDAAQAKLATFYYPFWKATVNGKPTEVSPSEKGLIAFNLPAERSEVRIFFEEPEYVRITFYISLFGWIIFSACFVFLFYQFIKKRTKK